MTRQTIINSVQNELLQYRNPVYDYVSSPSTLSQFFTEFQFKKLLVADGRNDLVFLAEGDRSDNSVSPFANARHTLTLSTLHDTLLPKLLFGKLPGPATLTATQEVLA